MFLSVSERTLRRRRQEMGWPMGEHEFSDIICDIDVLALMPELQTENNVQVPLSAITLSPMQLEMLTLIVKPFKKSDDQGSGVNLSCRAVTVTASIVNSL